MITKDEGFNLSKLLVDRFSEQIDFYRGNSYNETRTRKDFIDPFFRALNWDVDNLQQNPEIYREVIQEDKIKIGNTIKAPDYAFRDIRGNRLFFVEAKKPSVLIRENFTVAYQIRRYGWNAGLPINVITDFEEFAVYDCTQKPDPNDKASVARIKYLTFHDYENEFDYLWETFSREQILKGSLDRYVQSDEIKKGNTPIDKDFLISLDEWRSTLATNMSKRNQNLNEDEINFAVQQILNRLLFLRIAEEKGIEPYEQLKSYINQDNAYQNLFNCFKKADLKYNSGIFDLRKDTISEYLNIDNRIIQKIINGMYVPGPYEFSVIPVEILGSAYEQFLGKQIKIGVNHKVQIEEKPEVRKAGGVYYTPQYIVDYIVENTLGKLIKDKTPEQIEKIKIVDPACGSGSFLLGAYQYLLSYHQEFYHKNNASFGKKDSPVTPEYKLTITEKKRILINNIYGVDIDDNAVEVTKLSLLLKCMEDETETTIAQHYQLCHDRVLPTLDNNIRSGNSLIAPDYYDGVFDFGEPKTIKTFDWQGNFSEVFQQGGFDVVIGNPPYVRQELLGEQKKYFKSHYRVFHGMADLYSYFIEKGINLLNPKGLYGMIVANKWMRTNYGEPLRDWLKSQSIYQIIDFGDLPVFESVTTYPSIIIAGKTNDTNESIEIMKVKTLKNSLFQKCIIGHKRMVNKNSFIKSGWNFVGETENELLNKINSVGIPLEDYAKGQIFRGVLTGLNEAFVIDKETKDQLIKEDPRSAEIIKPFLAGRDIKRYEKPNSEKYLIFTKRGIAINNYPAVLAYLKTFKDQLTPKPKEWIGKEWKGRKPGSYKWYEIQDAVDYYLEFEKTKIIYPNILSKPEFTLDTDNWYCNQKCFIISLSDKYLLSILNSRLIEYLFEKYLPKLRGGFYEPSYIFLKKFPIARVHREDQKIELIKLVDLVLKLKEQLHATKVPSIIGQLQTQIEHTDTLINLKVYELYELTKEEINIIESSVNVQSNSNYCKEEVSNSPVTHI